MDKMKRNNKIFLLYFCMILSAFLLTGCGNKKIVAPTYDDSIDPVSEVDAFCIVTGIDDVNQKISLKAVLYATEYELTYTGGTDVKDKYGNLLSMSKVDLGSIVDIVYDANRDKLLSLSLADNDKIVQLQEVSGAELNFDDNTIKINNEYYQLGKNVGAFSDNHEIGLDEICSEDLLTVWLYNNLVCSIFVDLGHGYVKLADYSNYIGGTVEIGYDVIVPVTEDMLLTVREGEYTLRIAKGNDVGTKEVTVTKNQEMVVSLSDLAIEPKQYGSILFDLTPSDAHVYIDGTRVNAEGAVEIAYGKHIIYIMAEGYNSYSASFNVNYAYKIKKYTLEPKNGTETTETQQTTQNVNASTAGGGTQNNTTTPGSTASPTTTAGTTASATTADDSYSNDVHETKNMVTVVKPAGVKVYLDGDYIGVAPISFTKFTGSHIITLSMSGCQTKSYTVKFKDDGKNERLEYEALTPIVSMIN